MRSTELINEKADAPGKRGKTHPQPKSRSSVGIHEETVSMSQ
jgi:hypothetical protein